MNIPGKNGVHSMEDILADIRRKAADRKAGRMAAGGLALATAGDEMVSLGDEVEAGESGDLPAILRSRDAHPATSARLNVQPLRPTPGMRLVEALRRTEAAVHANDGQFHAANDVAVAEDSQPEATEPDVDTPTLAAVPDALDHAPMKRVMVSFLDTRMSRMAALSGPAPEAVADEVGDALPPFPTLSEIDEAALVEADLPAVTVAPSAALHRVPTVSETVVGEALALVEALRDDVAQSQQVSSQQVLSAVTPQTASVATSSTAAAHMMSEPPAVVHSPGAAEVGAAELLRPMLRQWLADNMPRIVEKALHMELADSLTSGKRNS